VTQGSHDVSLVRDIRDAGGAIGPVDGKKPELHNLTYGLSFANEGDIVFLTTDGISDNYDPVVTKIAVAPCVSPGVEVGVRVGEVGDESVGGRPVMEPQERHVYAMKEMERVLHEHELVTEEDCSAQELCSAMVQHVLLLTDKKRKVLENPELYRRKKMSQRDKQKRDSEIVSQMGEAPGKLDHASIVAYEVGCWRGDVEQTDSVVQEGQTSRNSTSSSHITSPGTKKIRPKKLLTKLKNNLNIRSTPSSPLTEQPPSIINATSPQKLFKRSRTKSEASASAFSPVSQEEVTSGGFPDYRFPASPTSPNHAGLPFAGNQYPNPPAFESSV